LFLLGIFFYKPLPNEKSILPDGITRKYIMVYLVFVLSGLTFLALSGLPLGLWRNRASQIVTVFLFSLGSVMGLTGTVGTLFLSTPLSLSLPWFLPWGQFSILIDRLSAIFLILVFTLPLLGAIFGLGYWNQREHRDNGGRLGVFYGLLSAGMALVVLAQDGVLFLLAWEIMALSAYFTASTEDHKAEVRKAGWVYLVATHAGTLLLLAMFTLWRDATGSFSLFVAPGIAPQRADLIFVLAVIGFGFKAGIMPFHVWLPGAHANAPSHVSAVMSGVMLKMGVYGILRVVSLVTLIPSWWGLSLLLLGAVSALFGIAFALGQGDLKRILAYSSIENIGIIFMGMGLGLLGKSYGEGTLILFGLGGALFHVWNHGLFKSLLFLNSGSIIHATETRNIEQMGGLIKKMPQTAFLFIVGALAISALPPLNGFAGEWLLYLGMFSALSVSGSMEIALATISAVVLAMVGALAVMVFVRLVSTIFLGSPRSETLPLAHDPALVMRIPPYIIAILCIFLGLFPWSVLSLLRDGVHVWAPAQTQNLSFTALVNPLWLTTMGLALVLTFVVGALWYHHRRRRSAGVPIQPTWDCGYGKPTARMQYTAASLGQRMVRLFSFVLWPSLTRIRLQRPFPEKEQFQSAVPDTVLDRWVLPIFEKANHVIKRVYILQQGQTYLYVLYVVIITAFLFIIMGVTA
jgi:hydrogenase-4 component B